MTATRSPEQGLSWQIKPIRTQWRGTFQAPSTSTRTVVVFVLLPEMTTEPEEVEIAWEEILNLAENTTSSFLRDEPDIYTEEDGEPL